MCLSIVEVAGGLKTRQQWQGSKFSRAISFNHGIPAI